MSTKPPATIRLTLDTGEMFDLIPCRTPDGKTSFYGETLEAIARAVNACGEEDGRRILAYQPNADAKFALYEVFLDVHTMVFPQWKRDGMVACIKWHGDFMILSWHNPSSPWQGVQNGARVRLVRRVLTSAS